jgi:hypothetical protein
VVEVEESTLLQQTAQVGLVVAVTPLQERELSTQVGVEVAVPKAQILEALVALVS